MLPIKTILHATDFSPCSKVAFDMACALARDYGARLVVLHVHHPEIVMGEFYYVPPDPAEGKAVVTEELLRLQPTTTDVMVEHVMREGDPVDEVLAEAKSRAVDLIIMGTRGRRGVGRLVMGSVAEAVLRRAPCPVLVVKEPMPAHAASPEEVDVEEPVGAST